MNRSLSGRTAHRRKDFIVFRTKNTAFFKNPSDLTIGKAFVFCILLIFQSAFRSIWKARKNRPFMPFSAFTEPSKKSGGRNILPPDKSSCYYNHCFFRQHLAGYSVFPCNFFGGGAVSFCDIPDFFALFRKAEKDGLVAVLNFFIPIN